MSVNCYPEAGCSKLLTNRLAVSVFRNCSYKSRNWLNDIFESFVNDDFIKSMIIGTILSLATHYMMLLRCEQTSDEMDDLV